jgi:hypothetical protein
MISAREPHRAKASGLVEAARPQVRGEAPQFESRHAALLCGFDQQGSGTPTDEIGVGVQETDFFAAASKKTDDQTVDFRRLLPRTAAGSRLR